MSQTDQNKRDATHRNKFRVTSEEIDFVQDTGVENKHRAQLMLHYDPPPQSANWYPKATAAHNGCLYEVLCSNSMRL